LKQLDLRFMTMPFVSDLTPTNLTLAIESNVAIQRGVIWSIGLIIALLVMRGLIAWLRKRMTSKQELGPMGFTLADLRELRRKGAMTDEEFERAKAKIVQSVQAATARAAKKSGGPADDRNPPSLGV